MKKALLLGLSSLFLQSSLSLAQETVGPPLLAPQSTQFVVQGEGPTPLSEWTGGGFGVREPACPTRFWGSAESLIWWTKSVPVNTPLLTATTDPAAANAGALGLASTSVLIGGQSYDLGTRYGARFTLGGWFDPEGTIGVEGNYFFLTRQASTTSFNSTGAAGSTSLTLPYRDAVTGNETAALLAGAGVAGGRPGGASFHLANQLQGTELNLLFRLVRRENLSINALAGFRYINFREDLDYGISLQSPAGAAVPFAFSTLDSFHANNNFYGGQLGLRGEYRLGNFFVAGTGKLGLGSMNQTMDINGVSSLVSPGPNFTNGPGGFYALSTNSGHFSRNVFCLVPETEIKLGYNLTRNIQAFAGYNYLYLSNVERPGTGIGHTINTTQSPGFLGSGATLVGPTAPTFSFSRSDFWAQGINLGLQFKF